MNWLKKNKKVDWIVRAAGHSSNWPNRRLAREQKRLLAAKGIKAEIWERVTEGVGIPFIRSERKVY